MLFCASHEGMRNVQIKAIALKLREVHGDHSMLEADGLDVVFHPRLPVRMQGPQIVNL